MVYYTYCTVAQVTVIDRGTDFVTMNEPALGPLVVATVQAYSCLLYTSDAADE